MKLELLPNEILIECFEYLNGVDLFHSFDKLNYRFYKLIRHTPLFLDFRNVSKFTFDQICLEILSNSILKKQIYFLQLSNKDTAGQIEAFLSLFSLVEFPHLRSLTLTKVNYHNAQTLKFMLPLIPELRCLHLIDPVTTVRKDLTLLPRWKLQTSAVPDLLTALNLLNKTSSLRNLTLTDCHVLELRQALNYAPMLRYLNVQNFHLQQVTTWFEDQHARHLKHLILIDLSIDAFGDLEILVKQIPNLKSLIISTALINASRWEYLITSFLPQLTVFKFVFKCPNENILGEFEQFQTDFWHKQHQWYTEYSLSKNSSSIYTIPYILESYTLTANIERYFDKLNSVKTFNKVTNLHIEDKTAVEKCQHFFSNVISLQLTMGYRTFLLDVQRNLLLRNEYLQCLKMIVNLSNLKHIDISTYSTIESSSILLQILKQTSKLSSMTIHLKVLLSLFSDNELCKYLNSRITRLNVCGYSQSLFNDIDTTKEFCKIFPNIEHLQCAIAQSNHFFILLSHLSKLSSIQVQIPINYNAFEKSLSVFVKDAQLLKLVLHIEELPEMRTRYYEGNVENFSIWIDRNMN